MLHMRVFSYLSFGCPWGVSQAAPSTNSVLFLDFKCSCGACFAHLYASCCWIRVPLAELFVACRVLGRSGAPLGGSWGLPGASPEVRGG